MQKIENQLRVTNKRSNFFKGNKLRSPYKLLRYFSL